jgi:dephospho-CoA kinase
MAPPLTIGLTGGIAAGKSEALAAFGRLGAATLSSDAVVHDLLEGDPLRGELVARWGPEVAPEGAPTDRGRIGGIVFADPEELTWLESRIHPMVGAETAVWIAGLPADVTVAVIEVPLLFEGGREAVFDTTVSIVAAEDVRRERAAARGHALVDAREARQLTQEEKAERAAHVVVNDGSVADLEAALSALLAKLQG